MVDIRGIVYLGCTYKFGWVVAVSTVSVREFSYNPGAVFARAEGGETLEITRTAKATSSDPLDVLLAVREDDDRFGTFPNLLAELRDAYTEVLATSEVRDLAAHLPAKVRTLDALHIAGAESLGEHLTVLVSYDERMVTVARDRGLLVARPGITGS